VKDRYQNPGHEIDQIGACRCVHWHGTAFLCDHQVQKLKLHHDDPLASANGRLQKVIVNTVFGGEL
jgi:hypothetical protein